MSDQPVRTRILGSDGWLDFQEYFVRDKAQAEVREVRYAGADAARPASGVLEALAAADAVIVCPSNPITSIGPILAVPGIAEALETTRAVAIAVSPIVGSAAVSGPAGRLMAASALPVSAAGVAQAYRSWLDVLVLDERDRLEAADVRGPRRSPHLRPDHHDERRIRGRARPPRPRRDPRDLRMDVLAAVPVKDLVNAKQRLIPLLGADERQALARAMLEDVLAALAAALPGPVFVVTTDALVMEVAERLWGRVPRRARQPRTHRSRGLCPARGPRPRRRALPHDSRRRPVRDGRGDRGSCAAPRAPA